MRLTSIDLLGILDTSQREYVREILSGNGKTTRNTAGREDKRLVSHAFLVRAGDDLLSSQVDARDLNARPKGDAILGA